MIRFSCQCGRQLQASENYIGQLAACPMCGQTNIVPPTDSPPRGARINERGEIIRNDPAAPPQGYTHEVEDFSRRAETTEVPGNRSYPTMPRYEANENGPPKRECSDAVTALWLGLVGLFCCQVAGPIAAVYAIRALNQISQSQGRLSGRVRAIVGLVLGIIGSVLLALRLLVWMSNAR